MLELAFDVYPLGRYYCIPNDTRYQAGKRLVEAFRQKGFKGENDYSILLYHGDAVRVEISTDQKLAPAVFEAAVRGASRSFVVSWESAATEKDPQRLKLKLLATRLREEATGGNPFVSQLIWDDYAGWVAKLRELQDEKWGDESARLFFPGGLAEIKQKGLFSGQEGLVYLIINHLDPAAEPRILHSLQPA